VPDAKIIDTVFYRFVRRLEEKGIITHSGSIIDAAFVEVPKQRNTREENKTIKAGEKRANKHKKAQKDVDAW
jgi:hypothetical protein